MAQERRLAAGLVDVAPATAPVESVRATPSRARRRCGSECPWRSRTARPQSLHILARSRWRAAWPVWFRNSAGRAEQEGLGSWTITHSLAFLYLMSRRIVMRLATSKQARKDVEIAVLCHRVEVLRHQVKNLSSVDRAVSYSDRQARPWFGARRRQMCPGAHRREPDLWEAGVAESPSRRTCQAAGTGSRTRFRTVLLSPPCDAYDLGPAPQLE
jgi:hypothetical protein